MKLANKIGEGRYRECFVIEGTDLCAKRSKGTERFFSKLVRALLCDDPNETEFKNFGSLPSALRAYVPNRVAIDGEYLVMTRAEDYDGAPSKSMLET